MDFILNETVGYLVLGGVGLAMAAVVTMMVKAETKWLGTRKTSEWFYTAGRTIKTGLIASSVVSAWTWAATLLQSSTVTFEFGIAGAFWYAAGASIQVILFSILAIELKRKAPMTHTFPEIIYSRYGRQSHKVFLFFALLTNTLVTAMLVLGGAAVVNSLTGVDIVLAIFLLPMGIIAYTVFGGLKATFFAEYINTGFIFIVVLVFVSVIYFVSPDIGGIPGMYDKLTEAAVLNPVEGNVAGSFLTIASIGALMFGIINIVGNFGTVFVDQSYWQRAIAARPKSAAGGFVIGGLAWFAIPFALATTLGLAAVATGITLTEEELDLGLAAPTAAALLMGDLGAIMILTIVFTAVTAAGSSQLISVSSLVTYDIFRTYMRPSATGRQLMLVSRYSILMFGVGMGVLASVLFHVGLSLQYVYLMMGILIGSAVVPISLSLLWTRTNRYAATIGAVAGLIIGVSSWLISASLMYGEITVSSTGNMIPLLLGNIFSITTSLAITMTGSLLAPERFNFTSMKQKIFIFDEDVRSRQEKDANRRLLRQISQRYKRIGLAISALVVILWPAPLYLSGYVFTLHAFMIWVGLAVAWATASAATTIIRPMVEARHSIRMILSNMGTHEGTYGEDDETADESPPAVRVLVPVDGSVRSLRALNNVQHVMRNAPQVQLYLLYVIEWEDAGEEDVGETEMRIQERGKIVLGSVVIPTKVGSVRRIVKLGDPSSVIVDVATRLRVDMIAMGRRGLGNTDDPVGHVSLGVLEKSKRPVMLWD